jgi:methyl-accepting chemotaxis protein
LQLSQEANSKIINLQKFIQEIVNTISVINQSSQNQSIGAGNINDSVHQMSIYVSHTSELASKLDDAINSLTVSDEMQ